MTDAELHMNDKWRDRLIKNLRSKNDKYRARCKKLETVLKREMEFLNEAIGQIEDGAPSIKSDPDGSGFTAHRAEVEALFKEENK